MNPSFAYVYDATLVDKRYERDVQLIENELARRGIEGTTARASVLCDAKQLVKDYCKQGVKNLILVGSDQLFRSLVPSFADMDTTIGFLPIGPSFIGGLLGIPSGTKAVDVVAARLVESVDVGQVNGRPFFLDIVAERTVAGIEVDGQYLLRPSISGAIAIRNLAASGQDGLSVNPMDGQLEIVIQAEASSDKGGWSLKKKVLTETKVYLSKGVMRSDKPFEVYIDGEAFQGTVFNFSILPKKMRIITGKRLSE